MSFGDHCKIFRSLSSVNNYSKRTPSPFSVSGSQFPKRQTVFFFFTGKYIEDFIGKSSAYGDGNFWLLVFYQKPPKIPETICSLFTHSNLTEKFFQKNVSECFHTLLKNLCLPERKIIKTKVQIDFSEEVDGRDKSYGRETKA